MKCAVLIAGCLLLTGSAEGGNGSVSPVVAESTFVHGGSTYRLRAEKFAATTTHSSAIRIAYRVWREGRFLHPEDPGGGRQVAPTFSGEQTSPIDLAPFPDAEAPVGWSIRFGYGSGNTTDNVAVVILPQRESYREVAWNFKFVSDWRLLRSGDTFELWTRATDCGCAGTAGHLFVPERRVLSTKGGPSLALGVLDPDWNRWPDGYRNPGFGPSFVAGLRQGNPALMRHALDLWGPGLERWSEEFGLPPNYRDLTQLVEAIEESEALKARIRELCPCTR